MDPPPKQIAKKEDKPPLKSIENLTEESGEELLRELRGSLESEIRKVAGKGEFCKYLVICPGKDSNCFQSKIEKEGGCYLYNWYEKYGGIIRYFIYQTKELRNKGVDISDLIKNIKFIRKKIKEEKFEIANKYLGYLKERVENELRELEKQSLKKEDYILPS